MCSNERKDVNFQGKKTARNVNFQNNVKLSKAKFENEGDVVKYL